MNSAQKLKAFTDITVISYFTDGVIDKKDCKVITRSIFNKVRESKKKYSYCQVEKMILKLIIKVLSAKLKQSNNV